MENASNGHAKGPRKRPKNGPGDVHALKRKLWWGVLRASDILDDPEATPELILKAVHALSQAASVYAKLLLSDEVELRLEAIEERLRLHRGQIAS